MVPAARRAAASRAAAALVALALSGAVDVAGGLAPTPTHRCACSARRGRDHRCACPECARVARRGAEEHADGDLPPCHRAAGVERAEARRREEERAAREAGRGCVREDCGRSEDEAALGTRQLERFTLPDVPAPWVPALRARAGRPPAVVALFESQPDLPPPRA